MSRILLTAASRIGCVRSNNEDMVLAFDKYVRSDVHQADFVTDNYERFVIALADGMGGHNAGEVASEETLRNLRFYINDLPRNLASGEFNESMINWLNSINTTINQRGHAHPELRDMGTTLVAIIYYNHRFYWLNCGDSRLYRLRDGKLVQITTDHSLVNTSGIKRHSNVITNCIGAGCKNSYIDLIEFTNDFLPGDIYLLCSDGLNDMISDDMIGELLSGHCTANALCEAAIEAGGFDNVSTCVLTVSEH